MSILFLCIEVTKYHNRSSFLVILLHTLITTAIVSMVHLVTTMLWSLSSNAAAACWTSSDEEHSKKQNVTTATWWRDVRLAKYDINNAISSEVWLDTLSSNHSIWWHKITRIHRGEYVTSDIFIWSHILSGWRHNDMCELKYSACNWQFNYGAKQCDFLRELYSGLVTYCEVLLRNEYVLIDTVVWKLPDRYYCAQSALLTS